MKKYNAIISFVLIIFCYSVGYSQKITTGIYSGVNFSDIQGQDFGGKWESKPGPVQGIYLKLVTRQILRTSDRTWLLYSLL